MTTNDKRTRWAKAAVALFLAPLVLSLMAGQATATDTNTLTCANGKVERYTTFDQEQFTMDNSIIDANGKITLKSTKDRINLSNIKVPAKQRVWVTFFYEGAGNTNNQFGWGLANQWKAYATNADGSLNWKSLYAADVAARAAGNSPLIHPIFINVNQGSDNIFNTSYGDTNKKFPAERDAATELKLADLSQYNDGSDLPFTVDYDGTVDAHDLRKCISVDADGKCNEFDAGTELVFFLTDNKNWYNKDAKPFFSKKAWNTDEYTYSWTFGPDKNYEFYRIKLSSGTSYIDIAETGSAGSPKNSLVKSMRDKLTSDGCVAGNNSTTKQSNAYAIAKAVFEKDIEGDDDLKEYFGPSYSTANPTKSAAALLADEMATEALKVSFSSISSNFKSNKLADQQTCVEAAARYAADQNDERKTDLYTLASESAAKDYMCDGVDCFDDAKYTKSSRMAAWETEQTYWKDPNPFPGTLTDVDFDVAQTAQKDNNTGKWRPSSTKLTMKDGTTWPKFFRRFKLGVAGGESWQIDAGWLSSGAVTQMNNVFGVYLNPTDVFDMVLDHNAKNDHMIIGSPMNQQDQWVLGWEDLSNYGDTDFNDLVFRIELDLKGMASLQSDDAIRPDDLTAVFTSVTIKVKDDIPCEAGNINYYVAMDGGASEDSWILVEWDAVYEITNYGKNNEGLSAALTNWTPGNPRYTYRIGYIDFASRNIADNRLVWRAELSSDVEDCDPNTPGNQVPVVIDVQLEADASLNGIFSRSSPITQANVLYSATFETPASSWEEKIIRGHLVATRIYDPANPGKKNEETGEVETVGTSVQELWDAGAKLTDPATRNMYFVSSQKAEVKDQQIAVTNFSGQLTKIPLNLPAGAVVQAGSVVIKIHDETFTDAHSDQLLGDKGRTGVIDRYKGTLLSLNFDPTIGPNIPVIASFSYLYNFTRKTFAASNLTRDVLNITQEKRVGDAGEYYVDDINNDGAVNDTDVSELVNWTKGYKKGSSSSKRQWILGGIDHSTPAVMVPPGEHYWYQSMGDTPERQAYDTFMQTHKERKTLIFAGANDGMLHAFNAGSFRWYNPSTNKFDADNPKTPDITEYRGYFNWTGATSDTADYGDGSEVWAFIPGNLMARLKNNYKGLGSVQARVDASPAISDVYVNGSWKTVLLCAEGSGGDTVFALDVTLPDDPKLLWEFGHPDLLRSMSSPAIGRVMINSTPTWVAFFVSGATEAGTIPGCSGSASDLNCYPSVFMIDIADGSLIKRVPLDYVAAGWGGIPSGQPAIVDFLGDDGKYGQDGFVDFFYVGSSSGYMYKVKLSASEDYPDCAINASVSNPQPIYASPTVVVNIPTEEEASKAGGTVDTLSNVTVFWGTGDSPYYVDNTDDVVYHFYAYKDRSGSDCSSVTKTWEYALEAGERVFASAFASAGKIYFGTAKSDTEDPCSMQGDSPTDTSGGNLYILDQDSGWVNSGEDASLKIATGGIRATPVVEDEHIYFKPAAGDPSGVAGAVQSLGSGVYNNKLKETVITTNSGTGTVEMWWREVFR